ncbi:Uncharacterised protein [Chromobacterium violaceum]|uniref:Uncharacterized protein n=1 Tax=Chromobacterium violaceum TaxID=536 RepID=A0A447TD09_CHRVL|nr:Uncharacterised protein [Chromobacterium violaceum]
MLGQILRQIIADLEALASDNEFSALRRIAIMSRMVIQAEPLARQQAAYRSAAAERLGLQIVGLLP